eukprot:TRINITY_DN2368_c0_g1_i1.p1 TRINITY_DN2368_c0_g1~~TRINITY_DN2368_c0_g1_i1.p1  ORF type:complete len:763 (-),score=134.29 TRINITY_DN2368_c0_g1_i1:664-2952(-)
MDPEQTFLRVHARLSGVLARLLTPRFRTLLEYLCLCNAVLLMGLLVIMHVNFVGQPGCANVLGSKIQDAQIVQIKITDSWSRISEEAFASRIFQFQPHLPYVDEKPAVGSPQPDVGGEGWNVLAAKFWLNLIGTRRSQALKRNVKGEGNYQEYPSATGSTQEPEKDMSNQHARSKEAPEGAPSGGPLETALLRYIGGWSSSGTALLKRTDQTLNSFWQVWGGRKKLGRFLGADKDRFWERIAGEETFDISVRSDSGIVAQDKPEAFAEKRTRISEPTYLYSTEKGYLMLSEGAKQRSNVIKLNISISAQDACFGNRWQQLLIDNLVGYDTILMNSLLNAKGNGYLYNFQTKELYNLNYVQDFNGVPHGIDDFIVFKCGVLITSLFVFFTTTMSVSFTLRETQSRMLKFTVQLQHHARHHLPTYRLIFVHVVESLVFVPIMIGILFFLFEFFDDQLLAFMVLTLVWLCELFTMISVRTPLSMQYFPKFFFLYFMVFHIYFFSYTYGFSYLAFSAAGAFMQHLVLYFWNRFEVPALQAYLRRRAMLHQQGVHISSAIVTSTLQVASMSRTGNVNQQGGVGEHPWTTAAAANQGMSSHAASPATFGEHHLQGGSDAGGHDGIVGDEWRPNLSRLGSNNPASSDIRLGSDLGLGGISGMQRDDDSRANVDSFAPQDGGVHLPHGSEGNPVAPATAFTSFGSVLPWILGSQPGGLVSLLPIFRESREQMYNPAAQHDDFTQLSWQRGGSSEGGLRHRQGHEADGNAS